MPSPAEDAGLDVTMTVPARAGAKTLGEVTVTNHTSHSVAFKLGQVTPSTIGMTAIAVADGHLISSGFSSGMVHETTVEPQASVTFPAELHGYQCAQPGQAAATGVPPWLPAGDYTFVPTISITPGRDLAGHPVAVHWTGGL